MLYALLGGISLQTMNFLYRGAIPGQSSIGLGVWYWELLTFRIEDHPMNYHMDQLRTRDIGKGSCKQGISLSPLDVRVP